MDKKSADVGWKYYAGDAIAGKYFESDIVGDQIFKVEDKVSIVRGYSTSIVAGKEFKDPITVKFQLSNPLTYEHYSSVQVVEIGGENPDNPELLTSRFFNFHTC